MRKPPFCICENKDADQLRGNREADQRLCFRYTDTTIPLLSKSEISSFWPSSVAVQPGLCRTWSETPKTGFLTTRLIFLPLHRKLVELMNSFLEAQMLAYVVLHDEETEEPRVKTSTLDGRPLHCYMPMPKCEPGTLW